MYRAECGLHLPGARDKLDAGDKMILERLDRIEGFLQMSWGGHSGVAAPAIPYPPPQNTAIIRNGGISDGVGQTSSYRSSSGLPEAKMGQEIQSISQIFQSIHSRYSFVAKTAVMYEPSRQGEQISLMRPILTWRIPSGDVLEEGSDVRISIVDIMH